MTRSIKNDRLCALKADLWAQFPQGVVFYTCLTKCISSSFCFSPDLSTSPFLFIFSIFRMNLSVVSNGSSPTKQMCSKPE